MTRCSASRRAGCAAPITSSTPATSPAGSRSYPGTRPWACIESIGDTAAERWGVAAGDRVAVEVFQSCRACDACRAGAYQRCERHGLADMYGYIPVDKPPGLWGGYAETQYLGPDSIVHRIPDVLDPVVATLFNPLGAGMRWGVTVPGTAAGDVVAVLGPGVRGLSAAAAAKDAGAAFVMVTGRGARDAERLAVAADFGADLAVDVADTDPVRALRDATGGLADVVVDVTAKAPEAFAQAVALARAGGTVVVAGTRGGPGAGVPARPHRVQGAAHHRRARRRLRRVPRRARPARVRPVPVRRSAPAGRRGSTTPRTSSARSPVRVTRRRRFTA